MVSPCFFRLREFVTSGAQPHFYIIFNQGLQNSYLCESPGFLSEETGFPGFLYRVVPWEGPTAEGQKAWVQVPTLVLTHRMTLGNTLAHPGLQFSL